MNTTEIARVCHEVNKAICEASGDMSQKTWNEAEQWQQVSAIKGVDFVLKNPNASADEQHNAWMKDKIVNGWIYGEVKDSDKKTHPCIVAYNKLPFEQRVKDYTFKAIVKVLSSNS